MVGHHLHHDAAREPWSYSSADLAALSPAALLDLSTRCHVLALGDGGAGWPVAAAWLAELARMPSGADDRAGVAARIAGCVQAANHANQ